MEASSIDEVIEHVRELNGLIEDNAQEVFKEVLGREEYHQLYDRELKKHLEIRYTAINKFREIHKFFVRDYDMDNEVQEYFETNADLWLKAVADRNRGVVGITLAGILTALATAAGSPAAIVGGLSTALVGVYALKKRIDANHLVKCMSTELREHSVWVPIHDMTDLFIYEKSLVKDAPSIQRVGEEFKSSSSRTDVFIATHDKVFKYHPRIAEIVEQEMPIADFLNQNIASHVYQMRKEHPLQHREKFAEAIVNLRG